MKRFVSQMRLEVPITTVWDFYTNLDNLVRITLPRMHLRVISAELPLRRGSRITFGVRVGMFSFHWVSQLRDFDPPHRFTDVQVKGPFHHWLHQHEFFAEGETTRVCDTIEVGPPLGIIGSLAETVLLDREIHDLFRYREHMTRKLLEKG
jgi:ligand-binding SRPBCC domain-containing protein